jgi:dTDP-4-amino-4,6-dideoxygalactose transaminase
MNVAMLDLTAQCDELRDEIDAGFRAVMASGQFVLGPNVAAFEKEVADYLGVAHAIGCASGTDALHLALRACGIGPGDEVITTPFSFFGTVEAIVHAGARPVFADIDPHTFNLDPAGVESVITDATRAIIPVHLFGQPAAMQPLMEIAGRYGLRVIEDCAQSFGASQAGRPSGSFGDAGCFSFFPTKNLGGFGDGGMVVTNSDAVAMQVRQLGNHGSTVRYLHESVGFNSRLDELQAVVLRAKLKHIDRYNAGRRRFARVYSEHLRHLHGLTLPAEQEGSVHVYHQYTVLVAERDAVVDGLRRRGIGCAVHYPTPLHRQPALAAGYAGLELPVADDVARCCLSLPIYPELGEERLGRVVEGLREVLGEVAAADQPDQSGQRAIGR